MITWIFALLLVSNALFCCTDDIEDTLYDQLYNPECPLCKIFLHKPLHIKSLPDHLIEPIGSQSTTGFEIGELILAKTNENNWECAVYMYNDGHNEEPRTIHLCDDHQTIALDRTSLYQLKLIVAYTWQPHPPISLLKKTLPLYMNFFSRTSQDPFLTAKIIKLTGSIVVIGDLHGSSKSLRYILNSLLIKNIINEDGKFKKGTCCVFLGDYTDRSSHGAEVWDIIMKLKLANPKRVFLLKGNHEEVSMAQQYGFFKQWTESFANDLPEPQQKQLLEELYNTLASGLVVGIHKEATITHRNGTYNFILFIHAGLDAIAPINLAIRKVIASHQAHQSSLVSHSYTHPHKAFAGITWSDFFANSMLDEAPQSKNSNRGPIMKTYNTSAAYEYIERHYSNDPQHTYLLDAIIHGHQHIKGGISRLRQVVQDESDFEALTSDTPELIQRPSVYTCISSPEGLGGFGCLEDSYAIIDTTQAGQWRLTAHIHPRTPKRFAYLSSCITDLLIP